MVANKWDNQGFPESVLCLGIEQRTTSVFVIREVEAPAETWSCKKRCLVFLHVSAGASTSLDLPRTPSNSLELPRTPSNSLDFPGNPDVIFHSILGAIHDSLKSQTHELSWGRHGSTPLRPGPALDSGPLSIQPAAWALPAFANELE
jgi:hypothetical protein